MFVSDPSFGVDNVEGDDLNEGATLVRLCFLALDFSALFTALSSASRFFVSSFFVPFLHPFLLFSLRTVPQILTSYNKSLKMKKITEIMCS